MNKICINAFWKCAGSVILYSIDKCYNCKTAYEVTTSLAPHFDVSLKVLEDMYGNLVTPEANVTEIFSPVRQRVQFVSLPDDKDIEAVKQFLSGLYDYIPDLKAHKIIGYSNVSNKIEPSGCMTIIVHRRYSQNFRRFVWTDKSEPDSQKVLKYWQDKHNTMPGIHFLAHPDPVQEAIDRLKSVEKFYLHESPYIMQMMYWVIHGYGAIKAKNEGYADLIWSDDMDVGYLANIIREHLGPETIGHLEDEILCPSSWFNWGERDRSIWWAPESERNKISEDRLNESIRLHKELSGIDDATIQELIEHIV